MAALHLLASRSLPYGQATDTGFIVFAQRELPLAAVAVVGALVGWRENRIAVLVGLAWIGGAMATMSVMHPLWPRHLVLVVPGLSLVDAVGAQHLAHWWEQQARRHVVVVAGSTLAAVGVAGLLLVEAGTLQPAQTPDPIVATLQSKTSAGDVVLGDDQFAAAAAGRAAPPQYVDTSFVRLATSGVTAADLAAVLDCEHICAVVLATGRLAGVPGFSEWLRVNYVQAADLGAGRLVYLRPGCEPH